MKGPRRTPELVARDQEMALLYRQGLTLEAIGVKFGLTRERVRQLLRRAGVAPEEGGQAVACSLKRLRHERKAELRCMELFGVDRQTRDLLRSIGATRAYGQHMANARARGIDFRLSLGEWWAIWQTSGKWDLRGVGKGRYCMARVGDLGAYEVGNVHISRVEDNSREGFSKKPSAANKPFTGVFLMYPGRQKAWLAKYGDKRLGFFDSPEEANDARLTWMRERGLQAGGGGLVGRGRGWTIDKRKKNKPYFMQGPGGAKGYFATADEARAAYLDACRAYVNSPATA